MRIKLYNQAFNENDKVVTARIAPCIRPRKNEILEPCKSSNIRKLTGSESRLDYFESDFGTNRIRSALARE
jgi:hypothetical protein